MNRRAVYWAIGCAVLGAVLLAFGIHDVLAYRPPRQNRGQVLTLGQIVDLIVGAGLLVVATLIGIGQFRAHLRRTRHQRWVRKHLGDAG